LVGIYSADHIRLSWSDVRESFGIRIRSRIGLIKDF
jgi:hypothetical protein